MTRREEAAWQRVVFPEEAEGFFQERGRAQRCRVRGLSGERRNLEVTFGFDAVEVIGAYDLRDFCGRMGEARWPV